MSESFEKIEGLVVKKVGRVVVVEYFRHKMHPYRPARPLAGQRRGSLLCSFLSWLHEKLCKRSSKNSGEEEVDYRAVEDAILKTFGTDYEYYVFISDYRYRLPSLDTIKKFLAEDDTNTLEYVPDYADCDDFSFVLQGAMEKRFWSRGYAFGILWYYNERFGHAVNFVVDRDRQLWIVEPQNDSIVRWCENPDYCGKAYVVLI